ncbi:MAG: hypothetical protein R2792_01440 [Saprospiraceae bacterium]
MDTYRLEFEPRDVLRKLEFDKVIELLTREALTPMAVERIAQLSPSQNFQQVDRELR